MGDSTRGILFNDVNLSYGESASSVKSSFGHTLRSGSALYHVLDASNASAESVEAGLRATSSIWCSFVAVGDAPTTDDWSRAYGNSVVFVALEVWDGEGHVFWIADGVLAGEPPV